MINFVHLNHQSKIYEHNLFNRSLDYQENYLNYHGLINSMYFNLFDYLLIFKNYVKNYTF